MKACSVIDLFCGVGGLTHGFVREGFEVVAGIDSDASCRFAYEHNNGAAFIHQRIEDVDPHELDRRYPVGHTKILVGCAPCQPFSTYTRGGQGEKWKLLSDFSKLIEAVRPDVVSMENVPRLEDFEKGRVFADFVSRLKRTHEVTYEPIYCPDYGIPQRRTRLVLVASRFGKVEFVPKTHTPDTYPRVKDAIGSLPSIGAGDVCEMDPLHRSSKLSDLNMRRIKQAKPGGTWSEWSDDLIAACHKRETGASYPSVYGRMRWDEPSPTITTQCYGFGNGRFGHPEQDRAISLREAAILQSFPPTYEFVEPGKPYYIKILGRQIGNAVPVGLGQVIAKSIKFHLEQHDA